MICLESCIRSLLPLPIKSLSNRHQIPSTAKVCSIMIVSSLSIKCKLKGSAMFQSIKVRSVSTSIFRRFSSVFHALSFQAIRFHVSLQKGPAETIQSHFHLAFKSIPLSCSETLSQLALPCRLLESTLSVSVCHMCDNSRHPGPVVLAEVSFERNQNGPEVGLEHRLADQCQASCS